MFSKLSQETLSRLSFGYWSVSLQIESFQVLFPFATAKEMNSSKNWVNEAPKTPQS